MCVCVCVCVKAGGGGNLARCDALNQHHLLHDCTISLSATHSLSLSLSIHLSIHLSIVNFQLGLQALACKSICPCVYRESAAGKCERKIKEHIVRRSRTPVSFFFFSPTVKFSFNDLLNVPEHRKTLMSLLDNIKEGKKSIPAHTHHAFQRQMSWETSERLEHWLFDNKSMRRWAVWMLRPSLG